MHVQDRLVPHFDKAFVRSTKGVIDASGFEQYLSRLKGERKIACKMRGGNSGYHGTELPFGEKCQKYMLLKGIKRVCINRLRVMHGVDDII